jgi:multisubunit Na+/H+ antiporter MnhC subunit
LAAANFVVAVLKLAASSPVLLGCFPLVEYRIMQWVICGLYLSVSAALLVVVAVAKIDGMLHPFLPELN